MDAYDWAALYDRMASSYGLTPAEFLSFTPRQIELTIENLDIRIHNDKAFSATVAGKKMDFIDPEIRALERQIEASHAAQKGADHVRT